MYLKYHRQRSIGWGLGVLSLILASCVPQITPPPPQASTAGEALDAVLIAAPHGLSARSGLSHDIVDALLANPQEAVASLRDEKNWPAAIFSQPENTYEWGAGIELLGLMSAPESDALLAEIYQLSQEHPRSGPDQSPTPHEVLGYAALDALGMRYSASVVDLILQDWSSRSERDQLLTLNYTAQSAAGQASVISRLQSMIDAGADNQTLLLRALRIIEN